MVWFLAIACIVLILVVLYFRTLLNDEREQRAKCQKELREAKSELSKLKLRADLTAASVSNLSAIPYMAAIMADYNQYKFEETNYPTLSHKSYADYQRTRKIESELHTNRYKLHYLLTLYPELREILETDYQEYRSSHGIPSLPSRSTSTPKQQVSDIDKELAQDRDISLHSQQIGIYEQRIRNLGNQLRAAEAQRDELSARLNEYITSSFRLSDISPEKWDDTSGWFRNMNSFTIQLIVKSTLRSDAYELKKQLVDSSTSNLTAIPYMASIMADYETYSLDILAQKLNWGESRERAKKVKSIREIRKDAQAMVEKNLEAKYQLEYLLNLYPNLRDVIETDYNELPTIDAAQISEYDRTRDWLSKEEYQSLSSIERNQLALDRYKESHNKTKWQIGRDYELYVGYELRKRGYAVDYFGSYMGMEDLGRDLIANLFGTTLIVQCKYWSQIKTIHEKHINQLYGTMVSYCIEHDLAPEQVKGVLVTNITLSDTAKKMANYLHIEYVENFERGDYPCIKCNIGHGEGGTQKIYHLPFDQQYDATKIDAPGEFYAMTVKEAEEAGFRRAFKWFGSD